MLAVNPSRIDQYERYQEIVAEYNRDKDTVEIQKVMDDLFTFNDGLDAEHRRYLREGLESEAQLAVFDLLQKDSLTKGDREKIKAVAKDLLQTLSDGVYDADEIDLKANAVFAHIFLSGSTTGARVYH